MDLGLALGLAPTLGQALVLAVALVVDSRPQALTPPQPQLTSPERGQSTRRSGRPLRSRNVVATNAHNIMRYGRNEC